MAPRSESSENRTPSNAETVYTVDAYLSQIESAELLLTDPNGLAFDPRLIKDFLVNTNAFLFSNGDIPAPTSGAEALRSKEGLSPALAHGHVTRMRELLAAVGVDEAIIKDEVGISFDGMDRDVGYSRSKMAQRPNFRELVDEQIDNIMQGSQLVQTQRAKEQHEILVEASKLRNPISRLGFRRSAGVPVPKVSSEDIQTSEQSVRNTAQMEMLLYAQSASSLYRILGSRQAGIMLQAVVTGHARLLNIPDITRTYRMSTGVSMLAKQLAENEYDKKFRPHLVKIAEAIELARQQFVEMFPESVVPIGELKTMIVENWNDDEIENDEIIDEQTELIEEEPEAPEIIETPNEVLTMISNLEHQTQAFNRYWFDIGRKWRENGFADLMRSLVTELHIDKPEAPKLIGLLGRLDENGRIDTDFAMRDFEQGFENQSKLQSELIALDEQFGQYPEVKSFIRSYFIVNIQKEAALAREKWDQLSGYIASEWPDSDGTSAKDRLEAILFGQKVETVVDAEPLDTTGEITVIDTSQNMEDELSALRLLVDQLDEVLLPKGMNPDALIQQLRELGVEQPERINWKKFEDFIELHGEFGGKMYRSKLKSSGQSDGHGEVYYSLVFDLYGREFAVAESPLIDNATYIVDVANAPGSWLEMLLINKRDLRELGGHRIIHSPAAPYGPLHREKIVNHILDKVAE